MFINDLVEAGNVGHAMEFEWTTEIDSENYRNLNSLAKYNNGIFKSYKQQQFLQRKWGWTLPSFNSQHAQQNLNQQYSGSLRDDEAMLLSNFGVTIVPGQRVISPSGYMRWSQYGGRGNRPIQWMFVLDEYGVAAKYKLKFKGDMKSGTSVDAAGTKLEWERDVTSAQPMIDALSQGQAADAQQKQQAAANRIPSKHLGNIGDRIKGQAVDVLMSFGPRSGQFGDYYINKLVTPNGEELLYFGNKMGNKGDKLVISFTVGKHDIDSKTQEPITLIKRPKKLATPAAVPAAPAGEPKMLTPAELRQKDFDSGTTRESVYDSKKQYGVRYKMFAGKEGRLTTKEAWFSSPQALEKAVARIQNMGNFYEIDGYSYPQGLSDEKDGERIKEQKKKNKKHDLKSEFNQKMDALGYLRDLRLSGLRMNKSEQSQWIDLERWYDSLKTKTNEDRTVWVKGPGGSLKKKVIPDTDAQKASKLKTMQRQQQKAEEEFDYKRMAPIEDNELDWGRLQKIFTTGEYPGPGGEIIDIVSRKDTTLTINGKRVAGKKLGVYFAFDPTEFGLPGQTEAMSDQIDITVYRDPQKPNRLKATYG